MDDDARWKLLQRPRAPDLGASAASVLFVKRRDGNYRQQAVFEFYSLFARPTMLYTA
jgi:hypothetical protein